MAMHNKVCCIGTTSAKELFGSVNPVGQTIRVNHEGTTLRRDSSDTQLFP
jgi:hypothetical protein